MDFSSIEARAMRPAGLGNIFGCDMPVRGSAGSLHPDCPFAEALPCAPAAVTSSAPSAEKTNPLQTFLNIPFLERFIIFRSLAELVVIDPGILTPQRQHCDAIAHRYVSLLRFARVHGCVNVFRL